MEFLTAIARSLGWLSGALAGVTAVLYGLGFIATVTHQGMLGLDLANTSYPPLWYLGLGAEVAARWALQAVVTLTLVLVLFEAVRQVVRRLRARDAGRAGRLVRLVDWVDRRLVWLLALLALICVGNMMAAFDGALGVRRILFVEAERACGAAGVIRDLVDGDGARLSDRADRVVFYAALALGFCGYAAPRILSGKANPLPTFVFAAICLQALGAIPAAHGLFVERIGLREISAGSGDAALLDPTKDYFITRSGDGIWVWDQEAGRLKWLANGSFDQFAIGPQRALSEVFCSQRPEPADAPVTEPTNDT